MEIDLGHRENLTVSLRFTFLEAMMIKLCGVSVLVQAVKQCV